MSWIELVGYGGSALVAVSLMMGNVRRLRWINLAGALVFALYGALIDAPPVVVLNGFIAVVDVYHIVRLAGRRDAFSILEVPSSSPVLREFLRVHGDDLQRFFPGFDLERCRRPEIRLVLRDMLPVGVFVFHRPGEGVAEVLVDYVISGYRDFRNAHFVFAAARAELADAGIHTLAATSTVAAHVRYLRRTGFRPDPEALDRYTRPL